MRVKRRRSSSASDDEPLITMLLKHDDQNAYDSLCRHNKQMCEFCDRVFENRYRRIIHNMKHIIIPLLNLTVYQCKECLHHFTSQDDLKDHTRKKHPKTKLPEKHLVKKESEHITIDLTNVKSDPKVPAKSQLVPLKSELVPLKSQLVPLKSELVPRSQGSSIESGSIKSRLLFEDDLVLNCDKLLNNFTIKCQVNLEPYQLNGTMVPYRSSDNFAQSVHYDELVKPGVFRCKKCGKRFPARYDAIIHEASHLKFKNERVTLCGTCNEYIVGNGKVLMLHYLAKHKERPRENNKKQPENNIKIYQNNAAKTFSNNGEDMSKKDMFYEEEITSYSKTIMLCDLCFSFCKNNNSRSYACVGSINELGKRYPCKKCGSLFFEVKLVKQQINMRRHADMKKGRKKMSNEERLKSIKHRFKLLKN